jgi:hypothetical protein
VTHDIKGGVINIHAVVAEINHKVNSLDPLTQGIIFPEITTGTYPQLAC